MNPSDASPRDLFAAAPLLLGVVHLLPLPGSPRAAADLKEVVEAAASDANALIEGGMDGFIVENFGDAPFHRDRVEPITVAAMARITTELRARVGGEPIIGVNVLRNDAHSALAVAAAAGADLVRVNVHTGAMLTDQGWIEGKAAETLRTREVIGARSVRIAADIGVKHALRPAGFSAAESARETVGRGLADAVIVTGVATGAAADRAELEEVRAALPDTPLLVGSGATAETIAGLLEVASGVIVGTTLKQDGALAKPVDVGRVRAFVAAARGS